MKKKILRSAAALLLAAVMLTLMSGCEKTDVKSTISKFESSCQALDVKGMLECVNPTISKPVLAAMELLGVGDTSDTLDKLVDILGIFGEAGQTTEEFIQSIKIEPSDYDFNDEKDECTVTATLSYGDGESKTITIQMILNDDVWYISFITA